MPKGGADRRLLKEGKKARLTATMTIARRVLITREGGRRYSGSGVVRVPRDDGVSVRAFLSFSAALIGISLDCSSTLVSWSRRNINRLFLARTETRGKKKGGSLIGAATRSLSSAHEFFPRPKGKLTLSLSGQTAFNKRIVPRFLQESRRVFACFFFLFLFLPLHRAREALNGIGNKLVFASPLYSDNCNYETFLHGERRKSRVV